MTSRLLVRPAAARVFSAATAVAGPVAIAVDGTGMLVRCHRAAQRAAQLTADDGTPTGTLLMFISSLAKKLRLIRPAWAVIAWDGPEARSWRQSLYPGYKANRASPWGGGPDQRLAMEFCAAASLWQVMVPGFEADDILAAVQRHVIAREPDARLMIITDDADLHQLLGDELTVVSGLSFDATVTALDVQAHWGIPPWQLSAARALCGDESDGIPGLPGVGPARAAQMLARGGYQWPLPEAVLPAGEDRALVAAWRDIMELADPPRRPEGEGGVGPGYFMLRGQAELTSPDNDAVRAFFGKYQLASLSRNLSNGRLW
jgi:5'-3' exonuclease